MCVIIPTSPRSPAATTSVTTRKCTATGKILKQ